MRIAIDLDGTAWKYRGIFKSLIPVLRHAGHKVGILTAHSPDLEEKDYELWFARLNDIPDFYYSKPDPAQLIGEFKANAMVEYDIDILIDDFGGNNPDIEKTFFEFMKDRNDKIILKVVGNE